MGKRATLYLFLFPLFLQAQWDWEPAKVPDGIPLSAQNFCLELPAGLTAYATGTAETTGAVGILHLHNTSSEVLSFTLWPALIPATDSTQGYALPDTLQLRLEPGSLQHIRLRGFCTNPFLPPAGEEVKLPPVASWADAYKAPAWTPTEPTAKSTILGREYLATLPGTDSPVAGPVNIKRDYQRAARLVVEVVQAIEEAYSELNAVGSLRTPFHGFPQRQEDAVEQQAIWYALGLLENNGYDIDAFRESLARQMSQDNADWNGEPLQQDFESGVKQFWAAFLQVGQQARAIKKM